METLKHECGVALIRLKKPLSYFYKKYGTWLYGLNQLYILMHKQLNRGQDGAGIATIKLNTPPGNKYIDRLRSYRHDAVNDIFAQIFRLYSKIEIENPDKIDNEEWVKERIDFIGEILLGHLRYGTHGKNDIENCHPFIRQNNWMTRNLVVAGNFNMTNVDELLEYLYELGQHPKEKADTVTVLEKIGHFLDEENQKIFDKYKHTHSRKDISQIIADNLNITEIVKQSAKRFDGGYVICGLLGHGDVFVMRDPSGIRPAYWYEDDEVLVVASERPPIQAAFSVPVNKIQEVKPAHVLVVKKDGSVFQEAFQKPAALKQCSFERIYFSRGNDADIYRERKNLGKLLSSEVLQSINYNLEKSIFTFVPNSAETAFYGLVEGVNFKILHYLEKHLKEKKLTNEKFSSLVSLKVHIEKLITKDVKLRTFITQDSDRTSLIEKGYDISYGLVCNETDYIVVIDDSIVRGSTLKTSLIGLIDSLRPKKMVIVSSAPQVRYPDCYGIDISKLGDLIAFRAAMSLLKKQGKENIIKEVYQKCKDDLSSNNPDIRNHVKDIYANLSTTEISNEIVRLIKPKGVKAKLEIIFQTIGNLHKACPMHTGDWYFSGDYPTTGGIKVACKSFVNYIEGRSNARSY
ncbi:MAG: amidophosphoribosyltransferase [Solitalea-like symbiont of Acarus siro]